MKRLITIFVGVLLIFSGEALKKFVVAQQNKPIPAPEFKKNQGWLNTDEPLTLAALHGKIVLLDFWTYGCINCIHIIPDLKRLEAKYKNELVVVGVHSAKFINERESENIRRIILRYDLQHPVVNDADLNIWKSYHAEVYPTQILIDPNGEIVGKFIGEGQLKSLDRQIAETIEEFRAAGNLEEKPIKFALEKDKFADAPLLFPGKVVADEKSNRLFIADTNHNRIVVTKLDGTLLDIIGNGQAAPTDGDFQTAAFNLPQGMALDGNFLYVADTNNQLIRRINLDTKKVETIAGTGQQINEVNIGGAARKIPLNSPWDLQLVGARLFIAMAGN
ncbi:MAG: thioredoxin-like domain-containing protein, partial [Actinomycetota bacterium]